MGTRADFYINEDGNLVYTDWVGSIAWDGYPEGIDKKVLKAKTKEEFITALKEFVKDRDDFTEPKDGWPWLWENSDTTDYAYVFNGKKVTWEPMKYPDMSEHKNVQWGKKSGVMIISSR